MERKGRPAWTAFLNSLEWRLALHESGELLVEAGEPAAAVQQLLLAGGPGRVGAGVDVESDLLARRAIGGARLVSGAVVQLNFDKVIIGMDALFHDANLSWRSAYSDRRWKRGLIREALGPRKRAGRG